MPCSSSGYVFAAILTLCAWIVLHVTQYTSQYSIVYDFCINTCRVVWWPLSG